jgi:hypothetical protein
MKTVKYCKRCGNMATITLVSKLGGFTKLDLCDGCAKDQERAWNLKGIQFKRRNIMVEDRSWL